MTFLYDPEEKAHYFDNLQTVNGDRVYISEEAYRAYLRAVEDEKRRPEYYRALAKQAKEQAEEMLDKMEWLFQSHLTAAYNKSMEVLDEKSNQD